MYKCIELTSPNVLNIVEKPIPEPPSAGIVIKTQFAGVCHTDVHCWRDDFGGVSLTAFIPDLAFPLVLGHEVSGTVHSVGPQYTGPLRVGARVLLYPWVGCGTCPMCRHGHNRWCEAMFARSYGVGRPGGYQAYVACTDPAFAVEVPDGLDMAVASLAGCGALTAYGALQDMRNTVEMYCKCTGSANVLISGAGGLGLWAVALARAILPAETRVYVADINEEKFPAAIELGATKGVLWSRKDSAAELTEKTLASVGGKVHGFLDLVASEATLAGAVGFLAHGGVVEVVGSVASTAHYDVPTLVDAQLTIRGHITGSLAQARELLSLLHTGKVKYPPMKLVKPKDIEWCLVNLEKGKVTGRQIIDFTAE